MEIIMKRFFFLICVNLLLLSPSFAQSFDHYLKLREGENQVLKNVDSSSRLIHDETKEFSNGNTFVRLNPGKKKGQGPYLLSKKSVAILIPGKLSANGFMELLFKISAAQKAMARKVVVVLEKGADLESMLTYRLPIKSMLAAAGATELMIGDEVFGLENPTVSPQVSHDTQSYYLAGDQHPKLRDRIGQLLGVKGLNWKELQSKNLADSMVYLVTENSFPSNTKILETMEQIYSLVSEHRARVHVLAPYLPYARSDKAESEWGVAPQGALIANLLEIVGMSAITVVQAHASQSLGFFKCPAFNLSSRSSIVNVLKQKPYPIDMVISPDAGFQKEATLFADELETSVFVLNKQRKSGGDATVYDSNNLQGLAGKTVLLIDDEVSGGSTLAQAIKLLRKHGAKKIIVSVTHLAGNAKHLLSLKNPSLVDLFVSDSFRIKEESSQTFTQVSLAPALAEHIKHLENLNCNYQGIIDIGSSKTKILVTVKKSSETGFEVLENYSFRIPLARSMYADPSEKSTSEVIKELDILLGDVKQQLDERFPGIQYTAIGTEALRKACQQKSIAMEVEKLPIPVRIISQEEEARLGYKTALQLNGEETKLTSWDHGGGSFQITCGKSPDTLITYQGALGSIPATQLFKQLTTSSVSPHSAPIKLNDLAHFKNMIKKKLPQASVEFMECLKSSHKIIGIGGTSSVLGIASRIQGGPILEKEKIWQGIVTLLRKWSVENLEAYSDTSLDSLVPRAALVHTIMEYLEVDNVEFKESNGSTLGILTDV